MPINESCKCPYHRHLSVVRCQLSVWRHIRTISVSAKIENLQNHKTIFEDQNSHISHTHSQASWTLQTYISKICTSQMCTTQMCIHGGVP